MGGQNCCRSIINLPKSSPWVLNCSYHLQTVGSHSRHRWGRSTPTNDKCTDHTSIGIGDESKFISFSFRRSTRTVASCVPDRAVFLSAPLGSIRVVCSAHPVPENSSEQPTYKVRCSRWGFGSAPFITRPRYPSVRTDSSRACRVTQIEREITREKVFPSAK